MYQRALVTIVLMAMTGCPGGGDGTGGDSSTTASATGSTGSTGPTSSTSAEPTGTGTTGPEGCAALACAACAECQRLGACGDLYATCSADPDCLAHVDCIIPGCIEQGPLGEACVEMCGGKGDLVAAADYLNCVTKVCDPACGF